MMDEDKQLNIAMLGTKFMGRAHAHAWRTAGRFFDLPAEPVLRVVAGRDADSTAAFAKQWGWERSTTRWRTAVTDDEVDLVDVATPNDVHAEQAIAALEAGKHVACEKPLAGTLDDSRAMRDAARKAPGDTFVWYSYRRVPAVALAHQLVQGGLVGRIYHVRAAYLQGWGGPDTPLLWRTGRPERPHRRHGAVHHRG
jgi:predicted dehydrogenase